jgi:molybdenum cofactor cytidylyltransferase
MAVIGVVPAAGKGSRFAASAPGLPHKLLTLIDGEPMVRRTVLSLLDGGAERCVVVVSPDGEEAVRSVLADLPVIVTVNPNPDRGMFSSIQCGVAAVSPGDQCILLPGDMPYVTPATVAAVLAASARSGVTVLPRHRGHRGHPMALSAALVTRILEAPATATLKEQRLQEPFLMLEVSDPGVRRDVDQLEDLR